MTFALAPMCMVISVVTFVLLAIPLAFVIGAALGSELLLVPALMVAVIYVWVWTRFVPPCSSFIPTHWRSFGRSSDKSYRGTKSRPCTS